MKKFIKLIWKIIWIGIVIFFASSLFFVLLYKFVNPPVTPLMIVRLGEQSASGEKMKLKKDWVPIDEISPNLQLAVIASEDNLFFEHHGFDFEAIEKAQKYNERQKGKRIHGASTISQQTAKNVFLWPQRSWMRKGLEVYFTFMIEMTWSKKRIMEVYLNVIETGNGMYGAETASKAYFGKAADKLSPSEAALLAAVLPNPRKWNPAHPTAYIIERQQWILWNMSNIGSLRY